MEREWKVIKEDERGFYLRIDSRMMIALKGMVSNSGYHTLPDGNWERVIAEGLLEDLCDLPMRLIQLGPQRG